METILSKIQEKAAHLSPIGNTLKFDFGPNHLFIDGTGEANTVTMDDKDADCTIHVSTDDLKAMMSGQLNPMNAVMSGKIQIKGDMGVAMKLQALFA